MSRQIRRSWSSPAIQDRVEHSGVANRAHRPQPLVKKSSGSEIIAIGQVSTGEPMGAIRRDHPSPSLLGNVGAQVEFKGRDPDEIAIDFPSLAPRSKAKKSCPG
jgi:hypothetical protein